LTDPVRIPFHEAPGRDAAHDEPTFDVARCFYDQRQALVADAPRLAALRDAVGWSGDLTFPQWLQWYALALGYQPDLILELGRGRGNSTALFTQAAARLGSTRVVSLCMSADWQDEVAGAVRKTVEPGWFERLDARRADILIADYARIIGDAKRVLLLWDAHGYDVAEVVLGVILPLLRTRDHFVIMHDISDSRYTATDRSYESIPFWKGPEWQERSGVWAARTSIGWMNSIQNQIVAIADFATRNAFEIGSADHEYWQFFSAHPGRRAEMLQLLGESAFTTGAHWAFFSLNGKTGPFVFPRNAIHPAVTQELPVVLERIEPVGVAPARLPLRVTTAPKPSLYAAVLYWRMPAEPPEGIPVWLRVVVRVQDAPIGLGLLSRNGSRFLEKRLLTPADDPYRIVFLIGRDADVGAVVVYTWDRPESARVEIQDLAAAW
jgi:hypothetical protein